MYNEIIPITQPGSKKKSPLIVTIKDVTANPEISFFYVCVENHYVLQHIKWYRVISSLQRDTQFAQCTLISRNSCSWGVLLLHSIFPYTFLVSSACIRHFLVKNSMWLSAWHSTIIRKVASPQFLRKEMQASQMTIVVWQKDSPSMAL